MERVPAETIEEVWENLADADPDRMQSMMDEFVQTQPVVLGFLMAAEEDLSEELEQGRLMLLGMLIWQCFKARWPAVRQIGEEELDAAQDANVEMLERLAEESEMAYGEAVEKMLAEYNQMPLLSAVLDDLMSDFAEDPDLANEGVGMAMIYLKSMIDCIDSAAA